MKKDFIAVVEEAYHMNKGIFLDYVARFSSPVAVTVSEPGDSPPRRTTLPRIHLPQFSGNYDEWPSFRDLFQSIIGRLSSVRGETPRT